MSRQLDVDLARIHEECKMNFKNEILKIVAGTNSSREIAVALVNFIATEASESSEIFQKEVLDRSKFFLEVLEKVAL